MSDSDERELPEETYNLITELSERGNIMLEAGDEEGAIASWKQALSELPTPQKIWQAALWLHASLGEAYRTKGKLDLALSHFESAYSSADGHINPFVLINLGATLYDLGNKEEANDYLSRAYLLEGDELFEDFGGPYLEYLKAQGLAKLA